MRRFFLLLTTLFFSISLPSHAQWMVHDEQVYDVLNQVHNVINNMDQQLSIRPEQGGPYGSVHNSGDGITTQFQNASPNGAQFGTMATDTQQLLSFQNGQALHTLHPDSAQQFYGAESAGLTPNCNPSTAHTRYGRLLYDNCLKARHLLAAQLQQIHTINQVLNARNDSLQNMLQNSSVSSTQELQLRHYKLSTLQTLIANDQMRLQTALASYQALRQLYQEKQAEAMQAMTTGKSADITNNTLAGIVNTVRGAAGLQAGKELANAAQRQMGSVQLFNDNSYRQAQHRIQRAFGFGANLQR